MHLCRRLQDRPGNIAARANDDIRLKVLDDTPRLDGGCERQSDSTQILCRKLPAEALDLDVIHLISRCADQFVFNSLRRADECDLGCRIVIFDHRGDGERGIHMSARAAACHKYAHIF